jgi:hypothetical protein
MSERNQGIISGIEGTVTIHSDVDATTSAILLNNWTAIIAPTVTDDSALGYAIGSEWTDVTADTSYKLVDSTVGAAVWKEITSTGGGGGVTSIVAGTNVTISPVGGTGAVTVNATTQGPTLINTQVATTFVNPNETINCRGSVVQGTFAVTLPSAGGIIGTTFTLVNSGFGIITLTPVVGELINGSATIELVQYISRTVQSDGADWIII